jgi:hypothetical protein
MFASDKRNSPFGARYYADIGRGDRQTGAPPRLVMNVRALINAGAK